RDFAAGRHSAEDVTIEHLHIGTVLRLQRSRRKHEVDAGVGRADRDGHGDRGGQAAAAGGYGVGAGRDFERVAAGTPGVHLVNVAAADRGDEHIARAFADIVVARAFVILKNDTGEQRIAVVGGGSVDRVVIGKRT